MQDTKPSEKYIIIPNPQPTFYFVGVTTTKSSIMKVFPLWMEALERPDIVMEGVDHALHDDPEAYRQAVAQIKYDPLSLGALVTSHKISLLEAAEDMFDVLHSSATITGEVSCISKRNGQLVGHAKDPLTGGMSLDAVLGNRYFERTGGHVLNFGAGGSGKAIALHLIQKDNPADRPERFVMINRSEPRLAKFKEMVESLDTNIQFEYILNNDPKRNDEILASMPEGSVVINATVAIFMLARLRLRNDSRVVIHANTRSEPLTYPDVSNLSFDGHLDFVKAIVQKVYKRSEGFDLYFHSSYSSAISLKTFARRRVFPMI